MCCVKSCTNRLGAKIGPTCTNVDKCARTKESRGICGFGQNWQWRKSDRELFFSPKKRPASLPKFRWASAIQVEEKRRTTRVVGGVVRAVWETAVARNRSQVNGG